MNELKKGTGLQDGKYVIKSMLGQGGFGITYLAGNTILGKGVALKEFFFKEFCERVGETSTVRVTTATRKDFVAKFRKKFIKEARMISSLNHPNIVRIYDVFEENDTSYFTMEYINGESLNDYINSKGRLSPEEAQRIIREVASALKYIHSKKINHLDIKPGNILIEKGTGRIVLIDFGISKQYDEDTGEGTTTTPVGMSHGYSPIEQYREGGVSKFSPQSDIYALGATLFKMVTGEKPASALDLSQQSIVVPDYVPDNIARAIRCSMKNRKSDRPANIDAFLAILDGSAADGDDDTEIDGGDDGNNNDGGGDVTGQDLVPVPPRKSSKPLIWAIVAAVVVIIALVIYASGVFFPGNNGDMPIDTADSTVAQDTVPEETPLTFEDLSVTIPGNKSAITVKYPTDGDPILVNNIREWINEELGGTYKGSLDDTSAMMSHYTSKLKDEFGNSEFDEYCTQVIKKTYEDDLIVTFENTTDLYTGGLGGGVMTTGVTFRKKDGKRFSMDMIQRYYDLKSYVVAGLRKYFQVNNDQDLMENLMNVDDISSIPAPSLSPWIDKDNVMFQWSKYEISYGAAGAPTISIPRSAVENVCNATGVTFFKAQN